jgi:hypothetical protein
MALINDKQLREIGAKKIAEIHDQITKEAEQMKYDLYLQAKQLNEEYNLGLSEDWLYDNLLAEWVQYENAKSRFENTVLKAVEEKKKKYAVPTSDVTLPSTAAENDSNILLWILLPVAALAIRKMFGAKNTNTKRRKR